MLVLDRSTPYRVDPEGERRDLARVSSSALGPLACLGPLLDTGMIGLTGAGRF